MSEKRFSDLNDLQAVIEELEQEIVEQQDTKICAWFEDLLNEPYEDDSDENE